MSTLLESLLGFAQQIVGSANDRILRDMMPLVDRVNALEPAFQKKSDADLLELTRRWQERLGGPKSFEEKQQILDEILPEAFANVREAARRVLITPSAQSPYPTMRHFDVQLIGGLTLHRRMIAEMATGEGKTLVAPLAAYLNALGGDGVHIVTVNDYLAKRDCQWMGPVYGMLGLSAGFIQSHQPREEKKAAYKCDITYGTNSEFGFDYLRDNMEYGREEQVQLSRGLHYAIVDEVDNILIDEARTPLIISGPVTQQSDKYYAAFRFAKAAKEGVDYEAKEKEHSCHLLDKGVELAQKVLGVKDLYADDPEVMEWQHFLETALRAKEFFDRDEEYIIKDGEVVIVDEFTGRLMEGRVWSDGLHQAVTVKEGLKLREETQTIATITYQNFFRLYKKLAGMTGTAMTEAAEFHKIYLLGVLVIPTNLPLRRISHPDVVFRTESGKWKAVVEEIAGNREEGRPTLVGTTSIDKSEHLSKMLLRRGIEHELLNGRPENAARESEIVALAGQPGAVTLATNMAGRGTDIVLGPGVAEKGGLHVVGTERHEARRIDNQLRGRAGRQGDPGSSRFFVSFDDDLLRVFAPASTQNWLKRAGMGEDVALENRMVSRLIQKAQERVEEYNFDIRKSLLEYDEVMDEQRKTIYSWRQKIMERREIDEELLALSEEAVQAAIDTYVDHRRPQEEWDVKGLEEWFQHRHGEPANLPAERHGKADALEEFLLERTRQIFKAKCEAVGTEVMVGFGREVLLRNVDVKWKDHLYAMDSLKSGIGLRGWGQHDPKIEYKTEAGRMFEEMMASIADHSTNLLFNVHVAERDRSDMGGLWKVSAAQHDEFDVAAEAERQHAAARQAGEGPPPRAEPIRVEFKVGRNDPCPCGSGKKHKHCCGRMK